ncbi:uncharacterized protein LOC125032679 [Penaeus chinensis]|uniref:uncharacterized protein LOC125032679 n=1 Tax=Penaeus chinensis TaxID=139456 RepID=UPI001FB7DEA1|nr:uncharacterized protein LOC125032679 [Penaeus chinensis]
MGTSQSKLSSHPRSTTFSNPGPQVPSRITRTHSEGGVLHVDNLTLFGANTSTLPIGGDGNVTQREGLGFQGASGRGLRDADGFVEEDQEKDGKAGDVEVEDQDKEINARGVDVEGQEKDRNAGGVEVEGRDKDENARGIDQESQKYRNKGGVQSQATDGEAGDREVENGDEDENTGGVEVEERNAGGNDMEGQDKDRHAESVESENEDENDNRYSAWGDGDSNEEERDIGTNKTQMDVKTHEETTDFKEEEIEKTIREDESGIDLINTESENEIVECEVRMDIRKNGTENDDRTENAGADIDTVDTGRDIDETKKQERDMSNGERGPRTVTQAIYIVTSKPNTYANVGITYADMVDIGRDVSMDRTVRYIETEYVETGSSNADGFITASDTDTDFEEQDTDTNTDTYVAGLDIDLDTADERQDEETEGEIHRTNVVPDKDSTIRHIDEYDTSEKWDTINKGRDIEKDEGNYTNISKTEKETSNDEEESCILIKNSEKDEVVKEVEDKVDAGIAIHERGSNKGRDTETQGEGMDTNISKTEKEASTGKEEDVDINAVDGTVDAGVNTHGIRLDKETGVEGTGINICGTENENLIDNENRCLSTEDHVKDEEDLKDMDGMEDTGLDIQDTGGAKREAVREAVNTVTEAVTEVVTEVVKSVMPVSDIKSTDCDIAAPTQEAMKDAMNIAAAPAFPAPLIRESYRQDEDLEGECTDVPPEKGHLLSNSVADFIDKIKDYMKDQESDDMPHVTTVAAEDDDGSALMRLVKIVVEEAAAVLRIVLSWVFPDKMPLQRYDQYLLRDKKMSRASFRSVFNKSHQDRLQMDPSGATFDLFLLCLLFEHGTDKLAPSGDEFWVQPGDHLEFQLTSLREFRASVFRGGFITQKNLSEKTKSAEETLTKILKSAGNISNIEYEVITQKIQEMTENIASARSNENVQWNVSSYGKTILNEEKAQLLVLMGSPQLRRSYDNMTCQGLVPVKNINQHLQLEAIFMEVDIAEVTIDGNSNSVDYDDIFNIHPTQQHGTDRLTSQAVLLEGPSGFGKTTLSKKLMLDWSKKINVPRGLDNFELLIHVDCRNPHIKSFSELLKALMPDARKLFTDDDVVQCLSDIKTLVLVDSLDDLNMSSLQVVREMITATKSTNNMTVWVMSSPEAAEDLHKIVLSGLSTSRLSIIGVPKDRRGELAVKLYKNLVQPDCDSQESSGLEAFINATPRLLEEYWRCPLNLVLVASLWATSPESVKGLRSATDLLLQTDKLCQRDLLAILSKNPNTRHFDVSELKDKLKVIFFWLCNEALFAIKRNSSSLAEESIKRLKHACHSVGFPSHVVMANFLTKDTVLTASGKQNVYRFTHKRLQEFYAAVAIINRLSEKENDVDLTKVLFDLQTVLSSHNISTVRAQEVLRHAHSVLSETEEHRKKGLFGKINTVFSSPRESAVVTILREGSPHPPTLPIWRFQNVFAILLSFVSVLGEDIRQDTARELVSLLERTGLRDRDSWLDVLMNAGCDPHVAREMARSIPDVLDLDGEITVRDNRVPAYAVLLKYARPSKVTVNISCDPGVIPSCLDLLMSLGQRPCEVQLLLKHDFLHPKVISNAYNVTLHHVFQWCRVSRFKGQVTPTTALVLPVSLTHVSISLLDAAHYCTLAPILDTLPTRLPALNTLDILVGEDMVPEALHALPMVRTVHVYLAGVSRSTLAWACECARQLEPENGFDSLTFPRSTLNQEDTELLQSLLSAAGVTVPGVGGVTVVCADGHTITIECTKQRGCVEGRT